MVRDALFFYIYFTCFFLLVVAYIYLYVTCCRALLKIAINAFLARVSLCTIHRCNNHVVILLSLRYSSPITDSGLMRRSQPLRSCS